MLKLLIVEGNTAEQRRRHSAAGGRVAHELYAGVLREIRSDLSFEFAYAADEDASLPSAAVLSAFDGIVWTGSALNIYQDGREVERQIAFAPALRNSGAAGGCRSAWSRRAARSRAIPRDVKSALPARSC